LFDAADHLALAFIKIGSELGPPTAYPERLIEPLRELGTQAAEHGTRVAIETMRSRSSRPCRWEPKSSLQPLILESECCWMPGTYSAQARR
jgi:hypothetical protein